MNHWAHTITQRLQAFRAKWAMWAPPHAASTPADQQATLDAPTAFAGPPPPPWPAHPWRVCHAAHGLWSLAALTWVGPRHAQHGLPCEDTAAWRVTPGGAAHLVVADGVSAGARGDAASAALAMHLLGLDLAGPQRPDPSSSPPTPGVAESEQEALARQVLAADAVVQAALDLASPGRSGAATFVAVWIDAQGQGWASRVGDCRLYLWRWYPGADGKPGLALTQATQDQTFAALGEAPPPGVPPHNPARMVGNGHIGQPEVQALQLAAGDGLLLCSDGVHDVLSADALQRVLAHGLARGRPLQAVAGLMARLARRGGSRDDIGIALLAYRPGLPLPAAIP